MKTNTVFLLAINYALFEEINKTNNKMYETFF